MRKALHVTPPILIIDDEEDNIADLTGLLDISYGKISSASIRVGRLYDYVSSPTEAIELMKQRIEDYRKLQELRIQRLQRNPDEFSEETEDPRYRAVITDFNMDLIDGKDFLRVIFDRLAYALTRDSRYDETRLKDLRELAGFSDIPKALHIANQECLDFVQESFRNLDEYRHFLEFWNNPDYPILEILFAGAERGDYNEHSELNDLVYVRKRNGCEKAIVETIVEHGILPAEVQDSFSRHRRFNGYQASEKWKAGGRVNHKIRRH